VSEVRPLQDQFSNGLFGEESLFAKTLRKTLNEEQQARYQAALRDWQREVYGTAIDKVVKKYRNTFRPEQLQALRMLLVERTDPPLLYGKHDSRMVMFRISELPPTELKKIFDKKQMRALRPFLLEANGTGDYLVQQGVIEPKILPATVILRSVRTVVEATPE
jgi:hypothetical protein